MNQVTEISEMLYAEQRRLVTELERYDRDGRFRIREWDRHGLGGGRACVLEQGRIFERAGVNVSLVHGARVPPSTVEALPRAEGRSFSATGISMVLHPLNPYAPSFHANFRFFGLSETATGGADDWWFGGGCDLTPSYGFEDDAVHFHTTLRDWCHRHLPERYAEWKAACDDYFTIAHRGEMRGIGGVFFDHLTDDGPTGFDRCLAFVKDGVATVLPAYLPILGRRCAIPYGERQRAWQLVRRGRYVEFNLVYDRGTRFGLQTRGNIEAILMSMPPMARWGFDVSPEPGSPESELGGFLQPRDWAAAS